MRYHSSYQILYCLQRSTIINMLYALLYIFSEISTYLYDFQSVNTRYH